MMLIAEKAAELTGWDRNHSRLRKIGRPLAANENCTVDLPDAGFYECE
jgi:hypothetical protein